MNFPEIVSGLPMAGLWAAIGGVATQYLIPPVMQKLSGFAVISRNAGNIERATKDYISQMHLTLDGSTAPQNIRSIFIANGENASIMFNDGGKRQRASVRLDNEAGRWLLFQAKRNIDNPEGILSLFQTQVTPETLATLPPTKFRGERKIWVRPTAPVERFAGFFTIAVSDDTAAKIREPLDMLMNVMLASPEENINLSGPCHMAMKITDPETNTSDIIVMPTMKCEAELIIQIEAGEYSLPDRKVTPHAVRDAIVHMHATRAGEADYESPRSVDGSTRFAAPTGLVGA